MKVILLGKGKMLANIIESAIESGVEIAGVFRYERMALPLHKRIFHDLFKTSYDLTLIKKYKLPEINCKSANSDKFKKYILKTNADIIIVSTWKEKLSPEIIKMPKIGTVNLHPSLLPRYRGPNPYMQVIKRGEKKTGITLHLMDENFDTGAVLLQKEIDILPNDTGKELRERTFTAARGLISEFLKKIQNEVIIPIKQNESRASYFGNINSDEKMLDFTKMTAVEMSAHIRALHPWLPCYITVGNQFLKVNPYKLKILKSSSYKDKAGEILDKDEKLRSLTIICKNNSALKMDDLNLYNIWLHPFTKLFIKHLNISKHNYQGFSNRSSG